MIISIFILEMISFFDLFAVGLIMPQFANRFLYLGGSYIGLGLISSCCAGLQLISGPIIGALSDLIGRKAILFVLLLSCGTAYCLIGVTTSIRLLFVLRLILALMKQTQLLIRAFVADYETNESEKSYIYARMTAISGAGVTFGHVAGGYIIEKFPGIGCPLLGVIVGFCFLGNAGLVLCVSDVARFSEQSTSRRPNDSCIDHLISELKQSFLVLYYLDWSQFGDAFLLNAVLTFAMAMYYNNYTLYLKTKFNLTPLYIGYVMSMQNLVRVISSYFVVYIDKLYEHDHNFSQRNFHVFCMLSIALAGLAISENLYIYVIFLIPTGIAYAYGRFLLLQMILRRSHGGNHGMLIGASDSIKSLSGVCAPLAGGLINHYFGISYVIYVSLLFALSGLFISKFITSHNLHIRKKKV